MMGFELKSVRFNDGDSPSLSRVLGATRTEKIWTLSFWIKRGHLSTYQCLFSPYNGSGGTNLEIVLDNISGGAGDRLDFYYHDGSFGWSVSTLQEFRDPSAWYHFVINFNSTLATSTERIKIHVNGERVTALGGSQSNALTYPALNASGVLLDNKTLKIGSKHTGAFYDGYLAEVYALDGIEADPSYFGATNEDTNQWQPTNPTTVKQAVTFGNNGFYLPFSNDALATSFVDDSGGYLVPSGITSLEVLVVAGGGAGSGGGNGGGGGGAGGLVYIPNYTVTPGERISVNVGAGGAAQAAGTSGNDGANSVFKNITAIGGGGGGEGAVGRNGGSGGGGWQTGNTAGGSSTQTTTNAGYTSTGWGTAGGQGGNGAPYQGGGGGGAGAAGSPGAGTSSGNGTGGNGKAYTIADGSTSVTYAGGGGGGLIDNWPGGAQGGAGGSGGGGKGGYGNHSPQTFVEPVAGTANTGGGGGGGRNDGGGAAGGSGVVIIYDGTTRTTFTATDVPHTVTANGNTTNTRVSNHTVTANGDAHIIGPKVGSSAISFDGDGDYLSIPDSADWNFGTGSFTIEGWVNHGGQDTVLYFDYTDYDAGNEDLIIFHINAAGEPKYDDANGGSGGAYGNFGQLPLNTWAHLAFVKIGTGLKCYIDGVAQLVKAGSSGTTDSYTLTMPASLPNHTSGLWIGRWGWNGTDTGTGRYTLGYMDEIRVSNVARYVANFTPDTTEFSSDANTKLLIHSNTTMGSTTFTDSGASTHTITAGGGIKHVANKVGTGMAAFDGTTDYLTSPTSPSWDFGGEDFTIEFWTYVNALPGVFAMFAERDSNATNKRSWNIGLYPAGTIDASWNTDGTNTGWVSITTTGTVSAGAWTHIAWVKNGSTSKVYINGTADATTSTNSGAVYNSDRGISIGAYASNTYSLDGYIDDLRISQTARYTSTFTPSTTAFKDDKDTILLLHMDGGGGIDPETNLPTLPGQGTYFWDASTNALFYDSDTGIPTNKSLISFDGSGDKLTVAASTDFNFGTNPFTIEGWLYADTLDGGGQAEACTMLSSGTLATADNQWRAGIWSIGSVDRLSFAIYETAGGGGWPIHMYPNTFEPPIAGRWYHWAVTRSGNTWSMWTNGICTADDVDSLNWNMGANDIIAGYVTAWSYNYYLEGKQDQIRVSDISRYTGTYTQPAAAFSSDSDTSLLLHLDGANDGNTFTDSSSAGHTVSLTGNIVTKTAVKKFGTASGYWNGGSANYLTIADHADFQFGTGAFTIEAWVYPVSAGGSVENMIVAKGTSTAYWMLRHEENNTQGRVRWYASDNSVTVADIKVDLYATRWAYDTWHHIAVTSDGTTHTLLVDGNCVGACTARLANWNYSGNPIVIGNNTGYTQASYGYIDEVRISKGVSRYSAGRYTIPTTPFTTDANTKLLIQSDFSEGGLGADHSGNYNYFTPTNLVASDMMIDNPLNNFCTWNPIDIFAANLAGVVSEGNLKIVDSVNHIAYRGTFGLSSGKWYWEIYMITIGAVANCRTGICITNTYGTSSGTGPIDMGVAYTYDADGQKTIPGSTGAYGATYAAGDIVGVALDMDAGTITFYKNNATQGQMASGITDEVAPLVSEGNGSYQFDSIANFGQDSSFAGVKTAQGNQDGNSKGDFYYTPPSGHLALCTDNLSAPSIALPPEHNNSVLYTGTGSELAIDVGFQPDFTWIKTITLAYNNRVFDVVRGVTKELYTNDTDAEVTDAQSLKSFDSNGFTLGTSSGVNPVSTMVSYNWKAGGTAVSNSNGTITSSVSTNTTAGFSIVSFTGNQTSGATVGHGLSQAPELIIIKGLPDVDQWSVYFAPVGNTKASYLNLDNAPATATGFWNDTSPTASVFTLGNETQLNKNANPYITYCFHSVEGYSKIGSYVGNGVSQNGPFVYLGFKPSFLMIKNESATAWWGIWSNKLDPDNPLTYEVYPNSNVAIGNNTGSTNGPGTFDFTSNGFKGRRKAAESMVNTNGSTYTYIAFAESPFKTSNAR